jgi:hypothetical protein
MRPDLGDVVAGVQRLLQNEMVPALGDPYLQEQAAYASLLLEYVKSAWTREHIAIAEEHADLAACLRAIGSALRANEDAPAQLLADEVSAALEAHVAPVADTPLDRVLEVDRERRALLEQALRLLDGPAPAPAGRPIAAARDAIDGYLVRTAGRRDAVLRALGVSW